MLTHEELLIVGVLYSLTLFLVALGILVTRARDLFEPVLGIGLLHILFFVVRPIMLILGNPPFHAISPSSILVFGFVGLLALVGFYLGYFWRLPGLIAHRLPYPKAIKKGALAVVLAGYILIGLISLLVVVQRVSLETALGSPIEVAMTLKTGGGYAGLGVSLLGLVAVVLFALRVFEWKRFPLIVITLVLLTACAAELLMGLRGGVARLVVTLVILWYYGRGRVVSYRELVVLGPAVLISAWFVIVPLNLFRHYGSIDWHIAVDLNFIVGQLVALLQPVDWGMFVYENVEPLLWIPYVNLVVAMVPRQLWPEKPVISIEAMLTEQFGGDIRFGPTRTMTIPGELQIQLPFLGVVLGMAALGILLRMLYEYRRFHYRNWGANVAYAVVYVGTLKAFYASFHTWSVQTIETMLTLAVIFTIGTRLYRIGGLRACSDH